MVEELLTDTKLIRVPEELAAQLKLVSGRLGTNVTDYTTKALSQALRIDDMGSNLEKAVDMYHLVNIHRGAGMINLPRNSLTALVSMLSKKKAQQLLDGAFEAGRWYAAYLSSKLPPDSILPFLENDLRLSWNLDEVEIVEEDVLVRYRATSFNMGETVTELLALYTKGVFKELGYSVNQEDILPGLLSLRFLKTLE